MEDVFPWCLIKVSNALLSGIFISSMHTNTSFGNEMLVPPMDSVT